MKFKITKRARRSLFGEILDWMLLPLIFVWPVSLLLTWIVAQNLAGKPFDRELTYNVQTLARLVSVEGHRAQINLPAPAKEILHADDTDKVYYQVLGIWGEFVSGIRDFPQPRFIDKPEVGVVHLRQDEIRGEDVRIAYLWVWLQKPEERKSGDKPVLIQVAETLEKRSTLAAEIIRGVMLPQLLILPLMVWLVWLALVRGTQPLQELERRIRRRKNDDVSPLDLTNVPLEVAPLIHSVNDLLLRLQESMAIQKRFLADAAHQLKTPLAGLRMQADLAQRPGVSADDLKQSLEQVGRSSIRATRMVNQLLALARAEASGREVAKIKMDLTAVVIDAVKEALPLAMDKQMDLGFDDQVQVSNASLLGNPILLKELVRNLLENAINYTPCGGVVTARVLRDPYSGTLALQVEDTGPGIPAIERERVLQPFYRTNDSLNSRVDGSGLGLAIVQTIAHQHGASLLIEHAKDGKTPPGTRMTIRFGA